MDCSTPWQVQDLGLGIGMVGELWERNKQKQRDWENSAGLQLLLVSMTARRELTRLVKAVAPIGMYVCRSTAPAEFGTQEGYVD